MKYTIEKMKGPLSFLDDKKKEIKLNGYAFIDECGQCIIITYGEGYRDLMSKYLSGDGDQLHIKYKCINL
jgi:hypothetical protein